MNDRAAVPPHDDASNQRPKGSERTARDAPEVEEDLITFLHSAQPGFEPIAQSLLHALWFRDPETAAHCQRVSRYALRLSKKLGLSDEEQRTIGLGALLHDIGKIGVPDAVLFKPSSLDTREWTEIRAHPAYGRRILEVIPGAEPIWQLVYTHHERLDGLGYPQGLTADELTLSMRIVILTDALDAMLSQRPYSAPFTLDQALSELSRNSGSQFDSELVPVFVELLKAEQQNRRDVG